MYTVGVVIIFKIKAAKTAPERVETIKAPDNTGMEKCSNKIERASMLCHQYGDRKQKRKINSGKKDKLYLKQNQCALIINYNIKHRCRISMLQKEIVFSTIFILKQNFVIMISDGQSFIS